MPIYERKEKNEFFNTRFINQWLIFNKEPLDKKEVSYFEFLY